MEKDQDKTKDELISELTEIRQRVAKLAASQAERKRVEEALRESEENYRRLFELSPIGITTLDMKGVVTSCNPAVYEQGGYSEDELVGKHFSKIAPVQLRDIPKFIRIFSSIIRGKVPKPFEVAYHRKDGTTGWTEAHIALLKAGARKLGIQVLQRDITEHKRAEEALRESEERYRHLVSLSPDTIAVHSEGKVVFINPAGVKLLKAKNAEQLVGKPIMDLLHPDYREKAKERIGKVGQGSTSIPFIEEKFIRLDGTTVDVEVAVASLTYQGKPAMQAVVRDITERKQAEEALRESEERYRAIVNLGGEVGEAVVMMQDTEQRDAIQTFVSDEWPRITGYSRKELLGMSFFDLLSSKHHEASLKRHRRKMTGENIPGLFEMSIIRKDGVEVPIELTGAFTTYQGKRANVAFIRDITERKQAEEKLRESEEKFRTSVETLLDGFAIFSTIRNETGHIVDFRYEYINKAGCRLNQWAREQQIGHTLLELLPAHRDTGLFDEYVRVVETGQSLVKESLVYEDVFGGDQRLSRAFDFRAVKLGDGFAVDWRDITEHKQAEEREKELQRELIISSRLASVGEMAAGIAHEINNPLTGVVGFASLLMKKDIPEDIRKDVEIIYDGAQQVASITSRMLTYAHQFKSEQTTVDINDIIKTTLAMRIYAIESSNIKVTPQLDPDLPVTMADSGQLQQVFLNIILNAETEMINAHGGGTLSIKTERVDNTIRVSFKDDGPGISKENLDRIFDPFFTTREVRQGVGLGLSVSHGIVTQHGGKIYAKSRLGKGATFFVELPIITKAEQLKFAEPSAGELKRVSRARILVVDDDTMVQQFLTEVLGEEGHEVEIVENGDDALDRLGSEDYDVILLDIKLPGMSGIDLYKHLQKKAKSLARRVVFITGDVMGIDTMAFLSRAKAPYITKPFDAEQLKKDIDRILSQQS